MDETIDRSSEQYVEILKSILTGMFTGQRDSPDMVVGAALRAADVVTLNLKELKEQSDKDKAANDKPAADKPADSKPSK